VVAIGGTLQLTALGTFADGSISDISESATWSSTDTDIAAVSNISGSKGLVSGINVGTAGISVIDPVTSITSTASGGDSTISIFISAFEIEPLYPINGSDWNDYIKNDGSDDISASDTACEPSTYTNCLHAGIMRVIEVPGKTSCAGLGAIDSLETFEWICDESTNPVRMISIGLNTGKGPSNLIDFNLADWKTNSVTISDNNIPIMIGGVGDWWSNPIVQNNDGSDGSDMTEGEIHIITSNPGTTYTIGTDKISLLIQPGITLTGDATPSQDIIAADGRSFTWIEGLVDADGDDFAFRLTDTRFAMIRATGDIVIASIIDGTGVLTVDSAGDLSFGGDGGAPVSAPLLLTTTGSQTYNTPVILEMDSFLTSTAGDILFEDTVDSTIVSPGGITIVSDGNVTFSTFIGQVNALSFLDVTVTGDNGSIVLDTPQIVTIGYQEYMAPVIIQTDVTLTTASDLYFAGTIDGSDIGSSSLVIEASDVRFSDTIGDLFPLNNLIVHSIGTTYLECKEITTHGYQGYQGDVVLETNNIELNSEGGITFDSTINGPYNLILNAYDSDILFTDDVGTYSPGMGAEPIGAMEIVNARNVTGKELYVTAFLQMSGTGTTQFSDLLYVGAPGTTHGNGLALIVTNHFATEVDLGILYLDVYSANITGFIGGEPFPTNDNIKVLAPIGPGTHFFNLFDMFYSTQVGNISGNALFQAILESLSGNYEYGFGYEFLNT
jgi:hypothetical protein